ncbi:hypothetical protein ABT294_04860 [Nonomuraea sp. NPDC000554]|uniref:hypothetical protein n=1 Tax=Nonomuraea sp. NPDC000554 TaxID=3154259 RepID=UPI003322DB2C
MPLTTGTRSTPTTEYLADLFAAGPDALGARMAGRAEEGIGEPETVALATSLLAADLLQAVGDGPAAGGDGLAVLGP